ncbi:hypothetical protein B0A48_04321 [Cryoendolithus antarcticus]|uniref:Thioredoxin domain-containing protein n=1 Tax=Cryoendolithus antarcticus TaxID=1507870 RepID=A0A1V8TF07_9PEZI|nr:hypothetical protein B0A48_04321 [Cryoendolithus antarcticus]
MATQRRQITLDSTSQYELPDAKTLEQASALEVLDEKDGKVVFKDLYSPHERTLVVFIRHFFCGMCEDYDLGMGDTTPQYAKSSIVGGTVKSMGNMLKAGLGVRHGGNYSQDGGEWVFEKGGELKWCRRMRNTRDHAEVAELKKVLGINEGMP